ncbi:hypothetical protein ACFL1M_02390 [Patescibacteria group bacterium]
MINDLKEHSLDYIVLFAILGSGAWLYWVFSDDSLMQRVISAGTGLTYILWGIIHHHRSDKVTTKVVLEYVLIAIFGFLVVNSLAYGR